MKDRKKINKGKQRLLAKNVLFLFFFFVCFHPSQETKGWQRRMRADPRCDYARERVCVCVCVYDTVPDVCPHTHTQIKFRRA